MNIKEQTVYIPVPAEKTLPEYSCKCIWLENSSGEPNGFYEEKQNQILLSKDELAELLSKAWSEGKEYGTMEAIYGSTYNPPKEQFINNLFNNQ